MIKKKKPKHFHYDGVIVISKGKNIHFGTNKNADKEGGYCVEEVGVQ